MKTNARNFKSSSVWRGFFLWKYYGTHSPSLQNDASDLEHAQSFRRCATRGVEGNGQLFRSRYVWVSSKIFDSVVMVTQVAYTNGESCWFETANSPRQSVWRGGSVFQYHVYHINNKSVQDSKKHVLLLSFFHVLQFWPSLCRATLRQREGQNWTIFHVVMSIGYCTAILRLP